MSVLLLRWGSYRRARTVRVLIVYLFFLHVMLPSVLPRLSIDLAVRSFTGVWKFVSKRDSLPGTVLRPSLFCFFLCFLYFFSSPFEDLGCFSGCLTSSAGIQKLFCGIYLAFKCSFDEFVGEKVFSPSYSSAILAPPPALIFLTDSFPTSDFSFTCLFNFCRSFFSLKSQACQAAVLIYMPLQQLQHDCMCCTYYS